MLANTNLIYSNLANDASIAITRALSKEELFLILIHLKPFAIALIQESCAERIRQSQSISAALNRKMPLKKSHPHWRRHKHPDFDIDELTRHKKISTKTDRARPNAF